MTDESGQVVWEGEFLPFGEPLSITGTITNNLRFPGQYYDSETGLHYNWHRYYKPDVGKYMRPDPVLLLNGNPNIPFLLFFNLMNPQKLNNYSYVQNNPPNFIDPEGLFKGRLSDIPKFLKCFRGLLKCARNIEALNKECQKECSKGEHGGSMYKCAIDKCWDDFQDCLKFALPGG